MASKSEKQPPAKSKGGRPTKYTEELALRICEALATSTESYEKICIQNPDFPDRSIMRLWRYKHENFAHMYMQARACQSDLFIEELLEIADDGRNDWMWNEKIGDFVVNNEAINRSRLRVDTRKLVACKLLPKIYGERKPDETQPTKAPEIAQLTEIINKLVSKYERPY